MGSFEDSIKGKFDGETIKAPKQVWDNLANELNAAYVERHQSSETKYKWTAIAAMLFALCSLAFQYHLLTKGDTAASVEETGGYYNALLDGPEVSTTSNVFSSRAVFPDFRTYPVTRPAILQTGGADVFAQEDYSEEHSTEFKALASLSPDLEAALVDREIYPYLQAGFGNYSVLSTSRKEKKIWAGFEAGAGSFNSSVGTSSAFSGSINQANLASAIGSEGFINPSTQVNPDLSNGVATSLGMDLGMRLGEKWTLETGVAYTNVASSGDATINILDVYTIDNSEFLGPVASSELSSVSSASRGIPIEVQDSYDYDTDLSSNLRFTSIPVKAGYFLVDRKMSLRLNVGLAANYFMGSQVQANNNVLNGSIDDSFNTWSFDGLGGVEIGYSIFDKFDVTLEPNYRQAITPITQQNAAASRFLIQTGLRYKIQ